MANEIQVSASLNVTKLNLSISKSITRQTFTLVGDAYSAQVQSIGVVHVQVSLAAAIVTAGYAWLRNLDATNFVQIGVDVAGTFYPLLKLKPGAVALVNLATTTFYAQADTAAVLIETVVLTD